MFSRELYYTCTFLSMFGCIVVTPVRPTGLRIFILPQESIKGQQTTFFSEVVVTRTPSTFYRTDTWYSGICRKYIYPMWLLIPLDKCLVLKLNKFKFPLTKNTGVMFCWNQPSDSRENFQKLCIYFQSVASISP